jgi:5-methylcytosine-specific restriction enzyme A
LRYCKGLHDSDTLSGHSKNCPDRQPPPFRGCPVRLSGKRKNMRTNRFYNTRAWQERRKEKLRCHPMCEYCRREPSTEVDHVTSINAGGDPLAWSNLAASCHICHSRKTYFVERLGRDRVPVKGCDINGLPLDPAHFWNGKGNSRGEARSCLGSVYNATDERSQNKNLV